MADEIRNEDTGFTQIPDVVIELEPPLTHCATRLYVYLRKLGDKGGRAFPGYKKIMTKCNIGSEHTVKKSIDELVSYGLLHVENRVRPDGKGRTSNLYTTFNKSSPKAGYIRLLQKNNAKAPKEVNPAYARPVEAPSTVDEVRSVDTGFTQISDVVIELELPLSNPGFRLYLYLRKLSNKGGQAFPGYKKIMTKCNIGSEHTVKKAIDELVSRGLVHVENRTRPENKGKTSNLYTVFHKPSVKAGYLRLFQKGQEDTHFTGIENIEPNATSAVLSVRSDIACPDVSNAEEVLHSVQHPTAPSADGGYCTQCRGGTAPSAVEVLHSVQYPTALTAPEVYPPNENPLSKPSVRVKNARACAGVRARANTSVRARASTSASVRTKLLKQVKEQKLTLPTPMNHETTQGIGADKKDLSNQLQVTQDLSISQATKDFTQIDEPKVLDLVRDTYGKYGRVRLNIVEYGQLVASYSDVMTHDYIGRLDRHIEASSKKYNNHCAVIESWIERDIREAEQRKQASLERQQSFATAANTPKPNGFANFKQRNYDYKTLEKLEQQYLLKNLDEYKD